jgi:hypothetical protein
VAANLVAKGVDIDVFAGGFHRLANKSEVRSQNAEVRSQNAEVKINAEIKN